MDVTTMRLLHEVELKLPELKNFPEFMLKTVENTLRLRSEKIFGYLIPQFQFQ